MKKPPQLETAARSTLRLGVADRMSISRKLTTMLLVPLAGLLVFASLQVSEKMGVVRSMNRLEELTNVAVQGSALLHELQRERGRSVRAVASQQQDSTELQAQRAQTDEALGTFRELVASSALDGNIGRAAESSLRSLQDLAAQRSMVNAGTARPADIGGFYGGAIDNLLALFSTIVESANTSRIALSLTSLDALMRMKEMAGRERAAVSLALSANSALQVEPQELARLIGAQDGFAATFQSRISADTSRAYQERMSASFATDLTRGRRDGFAAAATTLALPGTPAGAASTGTSPTTGAGSAASVAAPRPSSGATLDLDAWWRAATARIDALRELEQTIATQVLTDVRELKSDASWALAFYTLLAGFCTISAAFLSYFLAKSLIASFTEASDMLRLVVTQIGGFVREQAAATSETATAVSQTTTTVEELRKTADTANERSQDMSDTAKLSKAASDQALAAVTHGTDAMQLIRAEVEGIAGNILELSEKNIQIGEIVQSVNAIAQQSNLLAVNASIEAAKAGDHGKGFSVVATEVKALAHQSKQATDQIRALLAEIQKSSNGAVMTTEQGVKRVEEGSGLIEELGRTIRNLGNAVEENSESAGQISLISTQQLAGIDQITAAMRNIAAATTQNAEGARQLEAAADQIRAVSTRILDIVQGSRSHDGAVDGPGYA